MKITRIINGSNMEIELTSEEMLDAYYEIQHNGDKADIQELYDWLSPEEIETTYHTTKEKLDAGLEEMANDMRRNMDKWGTDWSEARNDAFESFLRRRAR